MKEYITPTRTANAIMQNADSFDSFLVLEGEYDILLFKKFIDNEKCKLEIGFGYEKVVEILDILNKRSFNKALGIIDSDFRLLEEEKIEVDNIVSTDHHDLEISVINSDAFQAVLSFHIQEEKLLSKYGDYENFKTHIFSVLRPLSFLKWLNQREKLGIIFKPEEPEGKKLDISKFICPTNLTFIKLEKLIETVLNYCNGKVKITIKKEDIEKKLNDLIKNDIDVYRLSNGHDVISLLSLSLRKHVSNLNSKSISSEQLQRELYLAYESRHFQESVLYTKIKDWEAKVPARILTF